MVVEWEKDPTPYASRNWPQPPFSEEWTKAAEKDAQLNTRHRAVVAVAPYDIPGPVDVHFFPCNVVKVSATPLLYGHPDYPYNEPLRMEAPSTCPTP
ncbi:hypothetical protein FQZ97_1060010 [compost metagenome]